MLEQQAVDQSSAPEAPVADTTVVPEAGTQEQQQPQEQAESKPVDDAAEETKRALRGVQKRINELTRQRHEAEEKGRQEAEYWRQQATEMQRHIQAAQQAQAQPVFNGDFEQYARDVARFEAQQAAQAALQGERERQAQSAQSYQKAAEAQAMQQKFASAVEAVVERGDKQFPGFRERITADTLPGMANTPAFIAILDTGDAAPAILNYLGNNPTKAHEIVALSPVGQVKAIGRIEAALAAGKTVSTAPPPPDTIGAGKSGAPKDPSAMNYDEFVKFRRRQIAQRR